ncbi:MAG: UPF0104 family protein, partial [Planctomycetota bacterium]
MPLRHVLSIVQVGVSTLLVAVLVYWMRAQQGDLFDRFWETPKAWPWLGAGFLAALVAVLCTFLRWYLLVVALGVDFTLGDALRLGFLGYFCNFFAVSSVGGDVFKAVLVARENPGRRVEVVASIAVDRIVGLYGLLLFFIAVYWSTDTVFTRVGTVRAIADTVLMLAAGATISGGAVLLGAGGLARRWDRRGEANFAATVVLRLFHALRLYRYRPLVLVMAVLLSVIVHGSLSASFYFSARGLAAPHPDFAAHCVLVPLAMLVGSLPLTLNGIGALEGAVEYLYSICPPSPQPIPAGQGLLVCLAYRLFTVATALLGAWYYIGARR